MIAVYFIRRFKSKSHHFVGGRILQQPVVSLSKGAQSRFAHIEKFSLNFSNLSFVIRVNLLHP